MATKHSAGPWNWVGDFNYTNGGYRIITNANGPVAHVCTTTDRKRGTPYDAPDAERDANAALICAAPDLLEALKIAQQLAMSGPGPLPAAADDPRWDFIVAAIAKAEGR